MKSKHTQHLLSGLPLDGCDAARLVLEAVEEMPELRVAAGQGREMLMQALRRVLRAGIGTVREQEHTVSFRAAAEESLARRERAGRRPTTLRDLRHFVRRLLRVPGLAERPLRGLGVQECRHALETAFAGSQHSYRKGRVILHSIFAYGQRQQWCGSNPVAAIEAPQIEEKEIVPLSLVQCQRLMETARTPQFSDCLPALGLMLFAGVRPGEVARLRWADVLWREGALSISARHSKTGGARRVNLCEPLCRLLQRARGQSPGTQLLCPPHWSERWRLLRQAAGYGVQRGLPWVADVLRHTYASYHAFTHRNLTELQLQLGHRDARLLLTRYINLPRLCRAEAWGFWRLAAGG